MKASQTVGPELVTGGVRFTVRCGDVGDVRVVIDGAEQVEVPLQRGELGIWTALVEGLGAGTRYGYRVDGKQNVLFDPWARAIEGAWCVVVDETFDWGDDRSPRLAMDELVVYEMHVRGFTSHESSRVAHPGTFLGVAEKLGHLEQLGINAVELLPVQQFVTERRLLDLGLVNSWGYNTLGYFAPHAEYGSGDRPGCQVDEFKTMVRSLHSAGIEVLLDVVFNHTAEQDRPGPTLHFKGFEPDIWYRKENGTYLDWTGCGNTVDFTQPRVIEFTLECLRFWVQQMHVDGFRFDLAPVLGRNEAGTFDPGAPIFKAMADDPIIRDVKLIAEPWDLFPGSGDCTGRFPHGWSEWNGRFRDAARRFVKGEPGMMAEMGWRLTGRADVYRESWHGPASSINHVTCHDGFTLSDLVSYEQKHNEKNGEDNRDGHPENLSRNWGVEGPSDDPLVKELRRRHVENLMVTLLTSRGVPMLLAGDEMLRTQDGNNNAYCQDEISWLDWSLLEGNARMFTLIKELIRLRRDHPVLRYHRFAEGVDHDADHVLDIEWVWPEEPAWHDSSARCVGMRLDGSECPLSYGSPDADFLVVYNFDDVGCRLPLPSGRWLVEIDTSRAVAVELEGSVFVNPWSVVVLRG